MESNHVILAVLIVIVILLLRIIMKMKEKYTGTLPSGVPDSFREFIRTFDMTLNGERVGNIKIYKDNDGELRAKVSGFDSETGLTFGVGTPLILSVAEISNGFVATLGSNEVYTFKRGNPFTLTINSASSSPVTYGLD